ncbi:MAG: AMP-binding protein [Planctomycetota bacterium]|jgi:acyl-CoA synthetase (AMP-forming)/AMP-acid ligase II|nr:AMP-binding protein [Planctomycetota bacterium]
MRQPGNVAERLRDNARVTPDKPAAVMARGPGEGGAFSSTTITFSELERDSDAVARGCAGIGIGPGVKTLVMLRPSFAFFSCIFGLFKAGAVPVLIDPGMGGGRLLECVRSVAPGAMIGIPLAQAARLLLPGYFPNCKINVTLGRRWFWGGGTWERFKRFDDKPFPIHEPGAGDIAAVLFTTGSTGPAKGVEYGHEAFGRQIDLIADAFAIDRVGDVDAATFPGFSLFSIALGMTAVVPDMDPARPGRALPRNIITPANERGCTFSFGSPALWNRVSAYAEREGVRFRTLRRVVMAGAPAPAEVHRRLLSVMHSAGSETYTPYGATECMPVANIAGSEILAGAADETPKGRGVCIGRAVPGVRAEIIAVTDGPIETWSDDLMVPEGECGEIAVQAAHASRHYHGLPEADRLAKIADGDNFWHRMGDIGYRDGEGRLWFCGRKSHRVETGKETLFTVCCEGVFNQHPEVFRSALVGVSLSGGGKRPVVVVEARDRLTPGRKNRLGRELADLGARNPMTAPIKDILFHPGFPTDIRHNAKIRREDLAVWAARLIGAS